MKFVPRLASKFRRRKNTSNPYRLWSLWTGAYVKWESKKKTKMREFQHECCGCETGAYPCLGASCTQGTTHFYCDECGEEKELYEYDGQELCADCILSTLKKVE